MTDEDQLLREYNPLLVILPQDFSRPRPYASWFSRRNAPRGDYHPCAAEFFLAHVIKRKRPKRWWLKSDPEEKPIGIPELKRQVSAAGRATVDWELDIGPIRSQQPWRAWEAYRDMIKAFPDPCEPTVYARAVKYEGRTALQYWYLYTYNDAGNYHEGDWEMVTLELDKDENPTNAGYSGHASGFRASWSGVQSSGKQPIVYVARGAHAAYFEHRRGGHRTRSLRLRKGLPPVIETLASFFQSLVIDAIVFLRWNDYTPAHPEHAGDEPWNEGEMLRPDLQVLPAVTDVDINHAFWWMMIRCRWGSSHSRLRGTAAPRPPWEREPEWSDPLQWLHALEQ